MGFNHQEVSSSKFENGEFTFDELLNAFHVYIVFEKLISKNKVLKIRNASLSQKNCVLK